jgi:hypothetical protein
MKQSLNNAARGGSGFASPMLCVCAMLILWACARAGDSTDEMTDPNGVSSAGGTTGASGASPGAGADAGSGVGSPPGADAGTLGAGGVRDGGGANVAGATAGTGGTTGMAAATGGMAGAATGGMAGTTTGGTGGTSGAGGTTGAGGGGTPGGSRPLSSTLKLPTKMETPGVAPFFHVWRPTDLSAAPGKLPIVVWNNGACNRNDQGFKALFEKWASGGYFVLSLTSGGGSSMTTLADHKALLDWAVAQAGMAGGPYNGKLDLDRIAAAGNSCGGISSLGLASMDPRVTAVFVLSGSSAVGSPNKTVINGIKVPVAYVVGGTEDIARSNAEADYQAFAAGIPAMMVKRSSGDHLMISNNAMVMIDAADISVNWLDLTLFGLQGALDALKTPTVCGGCQSGLWTVTSKNLETLVK